MNFIAAVSGFFRDLFSGNGSEEEAENRRWGMVIDLKKCIGCYGCVIACKIENFLPPEMNWSRLEKEEYTEDGTFERVTVPMLCMQCGDPNEGEKAPCQEVCPTGATKKRDDGIVWIDPQKCIGCKYCMIACPYGARTQYLEETRSMFPAGKTEEWEAFRERLEPSDHRRHREGTVEKCVFCKHRVDRGMEPKCVTQCPPQARYFGDLNDPESEINQLIDEYDGFRLNPELDTNPAVYYLPPR